MWKPIIKVIDCLYDRYGDKPMPIEPYKIVIDRTQLNHYKVCKRYGHLEYEDMIDDAYFEDYVKDSLVDKLADVAKLFKAKGLCWVKVNNDALEGPSAKLI
jgi:hypothetical protein